MALKYQDYYAQLGVARTATAEEIKQAFRALARQYHPDVAKNKVTGEARFKEINEAYEVLSDSEKRRHYDELGPDWQQGGGNGAAPGSGARRGPNFQEGRPDFEYGGTGFSDFFESFFSGGRGGFGSGRHAAGQPDPESNSFAYAGEDIEADLLVSLEEALRGSLRKVTLRRPGSNGVAERSDTYQVRVPAGVREGQRIRLAAQGGRGGEGGESGDLYLRVRLARHPAFRVQGTDLLCDLELAPWEAVLGAQVRLVTLDGGTLLRVKAGTQAGSRLRLRGMGMPGVDLVRGDLYAVVRIQIPGSVTPGEQLLWEQLARGSTFDPRASS